MSKATNNYDKINVNNKINFFENLEKEKDKNITTSNHIIVNEGYYKPDSNLDNYSDELEDDEIEYKLKDLDYCIKELDSILDKEIDNNLNDSLDLEENSSSESDTDIEIISVKQKPYLKKLTELPSIKLKRFNCPVCIRSFNSELGLDYHYNSIHTLCRCLDCDRIFANDIEYNDHNCDDSETDDIPCDPNGDYQCPNCENRYINQNLLGEHFIRRHNTYEEYNTLDKNIIHNGFPGFDILDHIRMIINLSNNKIKKIIEVGETCEICFNKYKLGDKVLNYTNNHLIDGYCSDSEININLKFKDNLKYRLNDERLIDVYNKFIVINRLPVKMYCCEKLICYECLETHLKLSNSLECPFCIKDHTLDDKDYIIITELDDYIDKEKWKSWWIKHVDIFY